MDGTDWNQLLDHGLEKPAAYIVRLNGSTVEAINGQTGKRPFSGSSLSTVLSSVFNVLTANRTWKERVVVKGNYTLDAAIELVDYVILDLREAKLTLGDGVNDHMSKAEGKSHFEVWGGRLDGNKSNNTSGGIIYLSSCSDFLIFGVHGENARSGIGCASCMDGSLKRCSLKDIGSPQSGGGIVFSGGERLTAEDCFTENTGAAGINVSGYSSPVYGVNIINCHVQGGGYCGINLFFNVYYGYVIGCEIEEVTFGWGIEFENAMYCAAIGNIIHDCSPSIGIKLFGSSAFGNLAVGNVIRNVGRHGIAINSRWNTVMGNTIIDAGQSATGTYCGIAISGSDGGGDTGSDESIGNVIEGNVIRMLNGSLRYGIKEFASGSTDYNIIKNNIILGTVTQAKISWIGQHTIVADNANARTENYGEATILSGQSSVTFNHEIEGVAADGSNLLVVLGPKHSEVADAVWSADATQITLTVPAAVSADRKISWYARRIS